MPRARVFELKRSVPHRSLPPCGGGTGRGVNANAECAAKLLLLRQGGQAISHGALTANSVLMATLLPVPPPQGGRERCGAGLRNASSAFAALAALVSLCNCASAEPIEDFYKGRTIN